MRTAIRPVIVFLALTTLTSAQNNSYVPDPAWKAPAKAAGTRNPLNGVPDALHKGHDIFEAQCSMCHGSDGQGLNTAANFHDATVQRESDGALFWKITNGHPEKGMPSFKALSDTDRWSLVSYLRTFKATKAAKTSTR